MTERERGISEVLSVTRRAKGTALSEDSIVAIPNLSQLLTGRLRFEV